MDEQYYDDQLMQEPVHKVRGKVRRISPVKAEIAMQKPRDATGKFLSGEELQVYNAQRQQQQFLAERARVGAMLGKQQVQQPVSPVNAYPQQVAGSNFAAMLQANKMGGRQQSETDKWDMLLGKRKGGILK